MMKGNQGLEALAALCGGRQKAVDSPESTSGAHTSSTVTTNTNPPAHTTGMPALDSAPAVASAAIDTSSEATKGGSGSSNYYYIQQASERSAESTNVANSHQHSSATQPPVASAPGPIAPVNLTPQQISQAILAAANSQGSRIDPVLAQSLLFSTALRGSAPVADPVNSTAVSCSVAASSSSNVLANTMQQLMIQQYLQAQSNAQQQAAAAAAAVANGAHPHAALYAMNLAAGAAGKGQHQHLLPNIPPAQCTTNTTSTGSTDAHRQSHTLPPSAQQQAQALFQQAAQQQAAQQQAAQQQAAQQQAAQQQAAQQQAAQQQAAQQQAAQQQAAQQQAAQQQAAQQQAAQHANQLQHSQSIHQQQYQYGGNSSGSVNAGLPSMIKAAAAAAGGCILPSTVVNSNGENACLGINDAAQASADPDLEVGDKKQQKRAANRRSAQLSRKRKKQFIEELKDENDELRRKEQILRAIPDLIVVFDSSGRLGFVSESVGRFFAMSPERLEGTSFWELICQDSVRLLKAAFMDALAAREADSDTAVLGSGVWELRLKNKNSQYMLVTLNGVVHFKGDAPECVCCIRPLGEDEQQQKQQQGQLASSKQQVKAIGRDAKNNPGGGNRAVSCSDGDFSRSSDGSNGTQQSVLNSRLGHAHEHSMSSTTQHETVNMKFRRVMAGADDAGNNNSSNNDSSKNNDLEADGTNNSIRISDGDSSSGLSD